MVRSGKNGGLHLKQISYYKRTGEYHPTTLASERSGIRRAAKKFLFKENKLFYVGKDRKQMRLVIVSDEEKKRVLHKCHESAAGAHHGISRTLTLVESSYYWTSITNDVKQWIEKNRIDEQQTGNKVNIKRKPKQINPFHLKVGHEVLRQRKNWWKDGRFQSEWVGPCIIDYITDNGCAILRDTTGSRLKRPIKMSHLKPYIRRSNGQDNHYLLQGAIVVDHDYVGLSESSYGPCPQDTIAEGEVNTPAANNLLCPPCKDSEPSECKSQSEFTEDHNVLSANSNPEQWSSSCWTLQTKLEDT
ncbi:hypothetical protein KIL84_013944 [Mauremys mutica]|uniref:Integrase zinc-binding domain-containing protein n=1 Tax=Mauremys mutica TaxID=74926 RepID=A0A9D3WWD2_9SAUR|nr:hypothetical protein KIL84_013944 [Mauremys mutica]